MTPEDLTPTERKRVEEVTADLRSRGYVDIDKHKGLHVGTRVRHRGEQYYEAIAHGTGNVIALMEYTDSPWSREWHMPDIEMIVLRDKPRISDSRLMQVAQYHVAVILEVTA